MISNFQILTFLWYPSSEISVCFFSLIWELDSTLCQHSSEDNQEFGKSLHAKLAVCFFAFFLFLDFFPHFSTSVTTITSPHWLFKPPTLHVFQLGFPHLLWYRLGPTLRQNLFKKWLKNKAPLLFLSPFGCFPMLSSYIFQSLQLLYNNIHLIGAIPWLPAVGIVPANVLMCMIISRYILLWFLSRAHFEEKLKKLKHKGKNKRSLSRGVRGCL